MKKPVLVIMAAGMGSRYGGLKQIDPVDDQGHIIMDFSIYDAKLAGFEKVVFIIKEENEKDFREAIGSRVEQYMETSYAFQRIQDIPEGFAVPEGRAKPWGTAHAVLSAVHEIGGPFAVINADDYYGRDAFQKIYGYLSAHEDDEKYRYTMVGYELRNTVTDNGHVARGICEVNDAGELTAVTERTRIEKREDGIAYTEDDGATWVPIPGETLVSMNMWGLTPELLDEIEKGFIEFLGNVKPGDLKAEYLLPGIIDGLLKQQKATVKVLETKDKWFGVTYKEDKQSVVDSFKKLIADGVYKEKLFA